MVHFQVTTVLGLLNGGCGDTLISDLICMQTMAVPQVLKAAPGGADLSGFQGLRCLAVPCSWAVRKPHESSHLRCSGRCPVLSASVWKEALD